MAEPASGSEQAKSSGGGKFKSVLLILIVLLVAGVGGAFYVMMPPKAPELKAFQWPPEGDAGLEISTTLGDHSAMLMTQVRLVTRPIDWKSQLSAVQQEFKDKRSIIDNILTEVGNSLDSETSLVPEEFKRRVRKRLNDELTHCEIDAILVKDWIIHSAG